MEDLPVQEDPLEQFVKNTGQMCNRLCLQTRPGLDLCAKLQRKRCNAFTHKTVLLTLPLFQRMQHIAVTVTSHVFLHRGASVSRREVARMHTFVQNSRVSGAKAEIDTILGGCELLALRIRFAWVG